MYRVYMSVGDLIERLKYENHRFNIIIRYRMNISMNINLKRLVYSLK